MANIVRGFPVCTGCKYADTQKCTKFNKECISMYFHPERHQIACVECIDNDSYEEGVFERKDTRPTAYFHIPGLASNWEIWRSLYFLKQNYPNIFYPNTDFSEIYGAFPHTIWNGRTPNFHNQVWALDEIEPLRDDFENMGFSINLTWNNHLVKGTDVYDRYCNNITKVFHNGKHSITVASKELYDYLKEKYPNFKYYQSVIMTTQDTDLTEHLNGADMLLWPRQFNNNWEKLKQIPMEQRDKIEFLCNDICNPLCTRIYHYNIANQSMLDRIGEAPRLAGYCTTDHDFANYNMQRWPITINPEDINLYLNEGFCHFKLCSRGDAHCVVVRKVLKYLIKPEFLDDAYEWILSYSTQTESQIKESWFGPNEERKIRVNY